MKRFATVVLITQARRAKGYSFHGNCPLERGYFFSEEITESVTEANIFILVAMLT